MIGARLLRTATRPLSPSFVHSLVHSCMLCGSRLLLVLVLVLCSRSCCSLPHSECAGDMAWRASASTYREFITQLRGSFIRSFVRAVLALTLCSRAALGVIESDRVENAMRAVDRARYTPPGATPYVDAPQSIGYAQTISAPHMHAMALELLSDNLYEGANVLGTRFTLARVLVLAPSGSADGESVQCRRRLWLGLLDGVHGAHGRRAWPRDRHRRPAAAR